MPPRRGPPSLRQLSLETAVSWLWSASDAVWQSALSPAEGDTPCPAAEEPARVLSSPALEQLRQLLCQLPAAVAEPLLAVSLQDTVLPARVRATALAALLAPPVARLVVSGLPERHHAALLSTLATGGGALTHLDLRGAWLVPSELTELGDLLPQLPALQQLVMPYLATDTFLQALGGACPRLRLLDISMSKCLTVHGAEALLALGAHRDLRVVRLGCPGLRGMDPGAGVTLLAVLPNLVCMGENEYGAECVLAAVRRRLLTTCRLSYVHAVATDRPRLVTLAAACPHLRGLYLDSPHDDVLTLLPTQLRTPLQKLKLRRAAGVAAALMPPVGSTLVWLELLAPRGPLDLAQLARLTPHLQKLEVHQADMLLCTNGNIPDAWPQLLEARLLLTPAPAAALELLLSAARLQQLAVDDAAQLSDAQLLRQLEAGCAGQLRELWLGWAPQLHIRGVRALLDWCPQLYRLGNVECIAVEEEVWQQLQMEAQYANQELVFTVT